MIKKLGKVLLMSTMAATMAFTVSGCSILKETTDAERAQKVIEAYQTDNAKNFKSYIESDDRMNYLLDGLDDTNAEGMIEVYQKVYELTKSAEFIIQEEDKSENTDGYATVTIKTVDFTKALNEAMSEAVKESGEAFADVPTWMMKALNTGGEEVEKEIKIRTHTNGSLFDGFNDDFFNVVTGEFYDWIATTMTTCTAKDDEKECTYMLSFYDNVKFSLDEYVLSLDGQKLTNKEVKQVVKEFASDYEKYEGIEASGNKVDDGIRLYMLIDYDTVSFYSLKVLGLTSSGSGDRISLSSSIKNLEGEGYTCERTDFGSGVISE